MINKLHPTAKKHGFKSNEDFYAVYPTKESYEKALTNEKKFAFGGPKTKTYTNKAEYDKALQAYSDSLSLSNGTEKALKYLDTNPSMENWVDFVVNDDPVVYKAWKRLNELNKKSPVFDTKSIYLNSSTTGRQEEGSINLYKKPVVKPEYNNPDALDASRPKPQRKIRDVIKTTLEQDYWNTDKDVLSFRKAYKTKFGEEPIRDASVAKYDYDAAYKAGARPSLNTEDGLYHWDSRFKADDHPNRYVDGVDTKTGKQLPIAKGTMEDDSRNKPIWMPDGTKKGPADFKSKEAWLKASGQKFAFGGFKYPNGGSFYDSSNINTSKPQVNTIPSSYTDTFTGNNSSVPKTTKDGINFSKDGKALTGSFNTNSSGSFSGNYLGMATAAVGGIGTTVNNANAATNERDKNRAIERGTVDTTMNIVDTAFPIVGAVEGVAGGIGSIIDSTNASTSYTDPNTGKTYNYKKGDSGTSAAGFKAAVDPRGNATNFIGDITGTTENYGQSNFGMAIADLFVPFLSQAFRNKQSEKAANQAQLNNSLINAQGVDSTSRNFSAFGGYKNKFPYGGNMKSEVTGKSYLKDQVSDFGDSSFKTHNEGGVMVDKVNEVEKPEIIWNDYVFSYQLKDKDGIPFSTRARKLIKQIK